MTLPLYLHYYQSRCIGLLDEGSWCRRHKNQADGARIKADKERRGRQNLSVVRVEKYYFEALLKSRQVLRLTSQPYKRGVLKGMERP